MNKKVVFPLVISALLLAGCNNQGESTPNLVLKEVPMHMVNIGAADKDGQIDLTKEEKTNLPPMSTLPKPSAITSMTLRI